jgi:hypothetical protein
MRSSAESRGVVVEFVGAPGAGKSSLLPAVRHACERSGLDAGTVVEFARPLAGRTRAGWLLAVLPEGRFRARASWGVFRWASALGTLARVRKTWPLASVVWRSQRGRPRSAEARDRRVVYWFGRLVGAHGLFLRRSRPEEVLLLDEGYVHRVVQLFTSAVEDPDRRGVDEYLAAVPRPDLLVAVHAPVTRCVDRIRARGVWTRFEGRDDAELQRFVASAHRAVQLAVTHARDHGWELVEVDNGGEGLDAAFRVVGEIVVARLTAGQGVPR